jgi:hypothetical protein
MSEAKAYPITPAVREQRRYASMRHGARSTVHLAPLVVSMKKGLLARMGIRQRDLNWAGRELLDSYCRAKAKVVAIDEWLETNPMINERGEAAGVMRTYLSALNSSTRILEALRSLLDTLAQEDQRFDRALLALTAEGRRVRESRE